MNTKNTPNSNISDNHQDPLWHALVESDNACPDGDALVALGALLRNEAQVTVSSNFAAGVCAASKNASEDDLIDAMYNGDQHGSAAAADPGLAKLRRVTRSASEPPDPINMLPDVLDGLRRRHSHASASVDDNVTRWRVWSSVVFGHVAALITVTVLWSQFTAEPTEVDAPTIMYGSDHNDSSTDLENNSDRQYMDLLRLDQEVKNILSDELPQRWSQLRGHADALFILRQKIELKNMYRSFYDSDGSKATVNAALRWLQSQQLSNGAFVSDSARSSSRALATHALAGLALLGDGLHDYNRSHIIAAGNFLQQWIDDDGKLIVGEADASSEVANGMALLFLVESAIMLEDSALQKRCAQIIAANLPQQLQRNAGLNGYFLLALETAQCAGIAVPNDALRNLHQRIRSGNKNISDLGKSGVRTFTKYINGFRDAQMKENLHIFAERLPRADVNHRVDPMAWFFPSLALREAGSVYWRNWNSCLQRELLSCFTYDNVNNYAWIPGERVRHANQSDIFATSMALLNLQAAYRYVPLL